MRSNSTMHQGRPMRLHSALLAALLAIGLCAAAAAQTGVAANPVPSPTAPAAKADPRAAIVQKIDGIKLEDVRISPVTGLYEVSRGSDISYLTADGHYAILGDMIDLDSDANLSENRRRGIRAHM